MPALGKECFAGVHHTDIKAMRRDVHLHTHVKLCLPVAQPTGSPHQIAHLSPANSDAVNNNSMMMKLGSTETTDSSKRLTPFSVTVSFLVILMMGLLAGTVKGQEIRIKLVDGRNGRVFSNQCVNVWVGKEQVYGNLRGVAMLIQTDKNGVASLHLTDDDAKVSVERGNGP